MLNLSDVKRAAKALGQERISVRVLPRHGGPQTGVFDEFDALTQWLTTKQQDTDSPTIDWSVNGIRCQADNVIIHRAEGIKNADIVGRDVLYFDIDSIREGDMATADELEAAKAVLNKMIPWLATNGIKPCLVTCSGNGFHVYVKLDRWPFSREADFLAEQLVAWASQEFSNDACIIDMMSLTPNRHARIPGTMNRKGSDPSKWRMSTILRADEGVEGLSLGFVSNLLEQAGLAFDPDDAEDDEPSPTRNEDFDIDALISHFGCEVIKTFKKKDGLTYYCVTPCPLTDAEHHDTCNNPTKCAFNDGPGFKCYSDDGMDEDGKAKGLPWLLAKAKSEGHAYYGKIWKDKDYTAASIDELTEVADEVIEKVAAPVTAPTPVAGGPLVIKREPGKEERPSFKVEFDVQHTDRGNGTRLAKQEGPDARYLPNKKKWLLWNGRVWVEDEKNYMMVRAKRMVAAMGVEAKNAMLLAQAAEQKLAEDEAKNDGKPDMVRRNEVKIMLDAAAALGGWARKSAAKERLKAAVELCQSEKGIAVVPKELDRSKMLFSVRNGVIDLGKLTFETHKREMLMTKSSVVAYDPTAACPTWEAFLDRIFAGDEELIKFMQRAVGYTLTGQTSEESLFLLYGLGANGKSTLLTVLRKVMGDYATVTPFSTFVEKKNDTGIPNDLAALKGARLVMASETKRSAPLAEAIIKQVTGRDPITARFLFGEYFTFVPEFKLWIATNHKPRIIGTDNGIWRRVKLIPFDVQIPEAEQDHNLDKKLEAELPGILNWALEGLRGWAANGLGVPPSVKEATEEFRANEDVLGHFIGAECVVGEKAKVKSSELYGKYKDWAAGAGEKYRLTQKDFSIAMTERGWQVRHTRGGNLWAGIGLKGKDYDLEEGLTQV